MTRPSSFDDPKSLYDLLELESDADERAIKSAFRRMARAHHPDVNPQDPQAHERFIEITAAFEILSDPARRELYDEFGLEGLASDFDPVRARWQRRSAAPEEQSQQWWQTHPEESWSARFKREYDIENSSFKSIFEKARRDFNPFQREEKQEQDQRDNKQAQHVRGEDVRVKHSLSMRDAIKGGPIAIEHHDGSLLTINVPAGARDGEVLLVPREGLPSPSPGGPPGDLILTIAIDPSSQDPNLTRDGLDLTLQLPVTMPEAILGAKLSIPTPHGQCVMTLPEGLHSGARLRLKEMGIWRDGSRGDFYVVIQIQSPTHITDRLRELARELAQGYPEDVRAKK